MPSEDDAMERQSRALSLATQVTPEFTEVYIWPFCATAASFVPSDDEAMENQLWLPLACAVQVAPYSPVVLVESPPVVLLTSPPVVLVESPPVVVVESEPVVVAMSEPGVSQGVVMIRSKRMAGQVRVAVMDHGWGSGSSGLNNLYEKYAPLGPFSRLGPE